MIKSNRFKAAVKRAVKNTESEFSDVTRITTEETPPVRTKDTLKLLKTLLANCKKTDADGPSSTMVTRDQLEEIMNGVLKLSDPAAARGERRSLERSFESFGNIFDKHVQGFITQHYLSDLQVSKSSSKNVSLVLRVLSPSKKGHTTNAMEQMLEMLSLSDECCQKLRVEMAKVSTWDFNVFTIESLASNMALFVVGSGVMETHQILKTLRIEFEPMRNLLLSIQNEYLDNPYHNSLHAADVTQTLNHFLTLGGLGSSLQSTTKFAALFAALVHDIGHPGRSNNFLIAQDHKMAVRYGYKSPLEHMHCAIAFNLLLIEENNVLIHLDKLEVFKIRNVVVDMVLATDNAVHGTHLNRFEEKIPMINLKDEADQRLMLQIALHAADVSNPAKPFDLYCEWTRRIMREFYDQGDLERANGIAISVGFDRTQPIAEEKMQAGFIIGIVRPVYKALAKLPKVSLGQCIKQLDANLAHWQHIVNT